MSNIYNKELEQAMTKVNDQLYQQTLAETNTEQAAKLSLYYAHGLTEKAYNKLMNDSKSSEEASLQFHKAAGANEVVTNIVTSSTAASTDAQNANSAVSTAAVNIQSASNALSELAGDVSRALSVATAKDYGDKINQLVSDAFILTQNAADSAEDTSIDSLNATIEAAQTRSAGALSQAQTVSGNIKSLVSLLEGEFSAIQDKIATDLQNLQTAQEDENLQAGVYWTSKIEEKSLNETDVFINEIVNYDLIADTSLSEQGYLFNLSFDSLIPAVRSAIERGGAKSIDRQVKKLMPTQKDIAEYRAIIVPFEDSSTFDIRAAKSTPKNNYHSINFQPSDGSKPARRAKSYQLEYATSEYSIAFPGKRNKYIVAMDYKGNPVKRGTAYVFYVYAIYTNEFQNKTEDTSGYLTLPSAEYTLLSQLPTVAEGEGPFLSFYNTYEKGNKVPSARVSFKVSKEALAAAPGVDDLTNIMEFRVFLFSRKDRIADKLNKELEQEVYKLFQKEAELREAEQDYLEANDKYQKAIALGVDSKPVVARLKRAADRKKKEYSSAQKAYNRQDAKVNSLNVLKVSNFFVDNDILKQIPDGDAMYAKVDPVLFKRLQSQLDDYKIEEAAINRQKDEQDAIVDKSTTLINDLNNVVDMEQEAIKQLKKDLKAIESEMKKDLDAIAKLLNDNENLLRKLLENGLPANDLEAIIEFLLSEDLIAVEDLLFLEELFKDYNKVIEIRQQIVEKESIIKVANQDIIECTNDKSIAESEVEEFTERLNDLKDMIENIQTEIAQLQGEKSTKEVDATTEPAEGKAAGKKKKVVSKPSEDTGFVQFVATAVGDIVDNYGEPMQADGSYCALVYSLIDPTKEPLALPLFNQAISDFSKPVQYTLQAI